MWAVDQKWMDHIDQMDQLRHAIGMRSVAQKDPVVEYRMEGSQMFDEMNDSIQEDSIRLIMRANISTGDTIDRKKESGTMQIREGHGGEQAQTPRSQAPAPNVRSQAPAAYQNTGRGAAPAEPTAMQPVKRDKQKVGRNDQCLCGSGKKYKSCCGKNPL